MFSLLFYQYFGRKTLGIAYSIAFCETILAPATPSDTARAGAIINPISSSYCKKL
ncbi:hypothetical protein GC017_00790 [Campylobacter hepaticus]|nr:hypothetical protein [Campylobacter bilis]MPV63077.1 hypothetical protein [Campylobacter hepaticus]